MADDNKRWQDMTPDEQAVLIRQINGAVNGLQFRIQGRGGEGLAGETETLIFLF
jgi:hypothetical protein